VSVLARVLNASPDEPKAISIGDVAQTLPQWKRVEDGPLACIGRRDKLVVGADSQPSSLTITDGVHARHDTG
jgi:hypothetical protein